MNKLVRYSVGHGAGNLIADDSGVLVIGNSFPSTSSTSMYGVASDFSGNLYISDSANSTIYRVTESGSISLFAGTVGAEGSNDGTTTVARFKNPHGMAVDKSGNIYIADTGNGSVRVVNSSGSVGTVATGLVSPWGVACAANGDVYVTDMGDHCVYRVRRADGPLASAATVIAGAPGTSGDISAEYGQSARFDSPTGIAVDPSGYILVADSGNDKIKRIGLDGFVVLFCGSGTNGNVYGTFQNAQFTDLGAMTCDKSGNLYVADITSVGDNYIKLVNQNGDCAEVSKVSGGHVLGITATPGGVVYITCAYATGTNSSSSMSSSSLSSSSLSSLSSQSSSSISSSSKSSSSTSTTP